MIHADNTFISELGAFTNRAKKLHRDEREHTLASVEIVGQVMQKRPWQYLNRPQDVYLKYIGLTQSKYSKRKTVYILFRAFPQTRAMFERGETEISHLLTVAAKITRANAEVLLEGIKNKSRREAEEFAARVRPDGTIDHETTIHNILTPANEKLLRMHNRAREVMAHGGSCPKNAEIMETALEFYLKAHDPMVKAERWAKKAARVCPA